MARPQKTGLEYFPFDVGLLKDKKLRRPKMKYGYLATAVYIALLSLLYSDKGYYIPYDTQNEKDDCLWYVFDCLQGKYIPKVNTIADVIDELVACGLFSGDRYPKYITSKRAQATYYSATATRKTFVINDAIWLLSLDEMKLLSEKHVYYLSKQSQPQNGVYQSINEVNHPINPQSKENQSDIDNSISDSQTKRQTEKEFYAECIDCRLSELADPYKECVPRFKEIISELMARNSVKICGIDREIADILKSLLNLFANPEKLYDLVYSGCKEGIKNKFVYTVATMYNAANGL